MLEKDTAAAEAPEDLLERASLYQSRVLADMEELRSVVDEAEKLIPDEFLPYPTYGKILFSLR